MNPIAKNFSLSQWLSWMEQCHPSEIELGLDRVSAVAQLLAIDLSSSKVVTVAGTNGKGSTVSYLDAIYRHAGYSVGCFTSPHFLHYNERVRIDGLNASDKQLCAAFDKIDQARGQIPLTYFEFGTLAALVIFTELKPDLVLLEVGLGGRLDAVNIIDADISLVTTVALDHMDWLGDDREIIGREKSGVYRANKPAICGDLNPPLSVLDYATEIGAEFYQAAQQFSYKIKENGCWDWNGCKAGESVELNDLPKPNLPIQNASTVLQAIQCIGLSVNEESIRVGIETASLTGRMQLIQDGATNYWLDVAHNPEAATLLAERISLMEGEVALVLGMLADKDCRQVMDIITPKVDRICLVDLHVPRGQTASELEGCISSGASAEKFSSVKKALITLKNDDNLSGNVIIAGSFFTVSDALTVFGKEG